MVHADAEGALAAAEVLRSGGVAVLPTDTVYGLAARPGDARRGAGGVPGQGTSRGDAPPGPGRLGGAGTRPRRERSTPPPTSWPTGGGPDRSPWPSVWTPGENGPAGWPGATRWRSASRTTTSCGRCCERIGVLVVTSANPHGAPTPRTARDVAASLGPSVDLIVDGGPLKDVPSTLVNVRGPEAAGRARRGDLAGRDRRARWQEHRDADAAGDRDVVRRDGRRRRRRHLRGALVGGREPDRPPRRVRRGGPRTGQPGPRRDDHSDRRSGPSTRPA